MIYYDKWNISLETLRWSRSSCGLQLPLNEQLVLIYSNNNIYGNANIFTIKYFFKRCTTNLILHIKTQTDEVTFSTVAVPGLCVSGPISNWFYVVLTDNGRNSGPWSIMALSAGLRSRSQQLQWISVSTHNHGRGRIKHPEKVPDLLEQDNPLLCNNQDDGNLPLKNSTSGRVLSYEEGPELLSLVQRTKVLNDILRGANRHKSRQEREKEKTKGTLILILKIWL